ncbi:MAG: hypothetical protein AAFU65_13225, partial [Pseudomonadota bacterium]
MAAGLFAFLYGCSGSASGDEDIAPAPTVSFSASPTSVDSGGTATLTWSTTNATSCTAGGGWSGGKAVNGSETTGAITADTTFDLTCTGDGGDTTRSVTVSVNATSGPTLTFSASPDTIAFNTASQLNWVSQNADTCTASGAWSGQKVLSGSATTGNLSQTSEFVLTCTGAGGSVSRSVTVTVAAPNQPGLSFSGSPSTVMPNSEATLTWTSVNASTCTASGGWSGNQALSGTATTGPLTQATDFTLTCANANGSIARTVSIDVSTASAEKLITRFEIDDNASGAGRPVTIGVPLGEGEVEPGTGLVVTQTDGTILTSQWNPLASWRTDNSQLHGALTFLVPDAGSASGTYEIRTGPAANGAPITRADVVSANFDATIQVVTGGVTYNLSARDLLSGTVSPRLNHTHFSGSIAAEFVVGAPLRVNGAGNEHPTLQGYFHVRAYNRPVSRVYVTAVLENTGVFNTLSDITGDVTISVGGVTQYTNAGFSIGADKRYPKRYWW